MKLKLDIEEMEEDFFEDTRLLGIMAPFKDYLFCWQLNHQLHFNFRINNGIEIQLTRKKKELFFLRSSNIRIPAARWYTIYIIISLTGNTCCPNSGTWIFYG